MTDAKQDFSGPLSLEEVPDVLQGGPLPDRGEPDEHRRSYAEDAGSGDTVAVVPDGQHSLTRPHSDRRTIMFEMVRRYNEYTRLLRAVESRCRQVECLKRKLSGAERKLSEAEGKGSDPEAGPGRLRRALREIQRTLGDDLPDGERLDKIGNLCNQVLQQDGSS